MNDRMTETGLDREKSFYGRDFLGVALGAVALFLGVSIVMSLVKGFSDQSQVDAIVARYVGLLGTGPGLLLCSGLAVFGGLFFVNGPRDSSLRDLLGILGTSVALAFLVGTLAGPTVGGVVGNAGHAVSEKLGLLGPVIGVVPLLVAIWFPWLRGRVLFSANPGPLGNQPDVLPREPYEGVSDAEADALASARTEMEALRQARGRSKDAPRKTKESQRASAPVYEPVELRPLYPEDVRLKGQIPEGAKPLEIDDPSREPDTHEVADSGGVSAESAAQGSAHPHLGADEPDPGPPSRGAGGSTGGLDPGASRAPALLNRSADRAERDEPVATSPVTPAPPPRPSWEQVDMFGAGDEPTAEAAESAAHTMDEPEPSASGAYLDPAADDAHEAYEGADGLGAYADAEDEDSEYADSADDDEDLDEDDLDEDVETDALEDFDGEGPDSGVDEPEPEVVLAPRAPARALLLQAGELILDRGRVAVSLLQREFDIDFQQATELLDSLQQAGLIGPYLGGQKRDILMTAEQWRTKVGAS